MKKTNRLVRIAAIGCLIVSLTGCNKLLDYVKDHGGEELTSYKISKLTCYGNHDSAVAVFKYNKWGDPESIRVTPTTTGRAHAMFRYDKQHRLTDYYTTYDDLGFDSWQKYVYDNKGRIIQDTACFYGNIRPDGPESLYRVRVVTSYAYDAQGRITQATRLVLNPDSPFPPVTNVETYTYDAKGNLAKPGVTYDNELNLYQTSKIWMFITRNYSVNNAFQADSYNSGHLPTRRTQAGDYVSISFLQAELPGNKVWIDYMAK